MKIFFELEDIDDNIESTSVALGTFDGLHIGHTEVLNFMKQSAKEKGMLFFEAEVLSSNEPALAMLHKLGFSIETIAGSDELVRAIKDLRQ